MRIGHLLNLHRGQLQATIQKCTVSGVHYMFKIAINKFISYLDTGKATNLQVSIIPNQIKNHDNCQFTSPLPSCLQTCRWCLHYRRLNYVRLAQTRRTHVGVQLQAAIVRFNQQKRVQWTTEPRAEISPHHGGPIDTKLIIHYVEILELEYKGGEIG